MGAAAVAINWVEQGYVSDGVIRSGFRRLCLKRLAEIQAHDCEVTAEREAAFLVAMAQAPMALVPDLANAWLANMDARREAIMPILAQTFGADQAPLWWMRWRLFFMACAETFGYQNGQVWRVAHYLLQRPIQAGAC